MKIGTKSVLFGAHQFIIHPLTVAISWWMLYGFPWDPRLWFAFFLHDIGYIGLDNMDGEEGERHVLFGAKKMEYLFGSRWFQFTLLHSRFYAKKFSAPVSRLCVADKYALVITPWFIYLPMVRATREIEEYKSVEKHVHEVGRNFAPTASMKQDREWLKKLKQILWKFVDNEIERAAHSDRILQRGPRVSYYGSLGIWYPE